MCSHARQRAHVCPTGAEIGGGRSLLDALRAVPAEVRATKQAMLRRYAPWLSYSYPKLRPAASPAPPGRNAVSLAVERLAADVLPG